MTEPFRPVLRSQADVEHAWRRLMQPLGFGATSVWMLMIGPDDRPIPQVTEIAEIPDDQDPDPRDLAGLTEVLRRIRDEFGIARVAFLRTRPGAGGINPVDRAWASGLAAAARDAGVIAEVVHLANDVTVLPIPRDELPATG